MNEKEYSSVVGDRIKIAMKDKRILETELADACGCSLASMSKYIYNKRDPRIEMLKRMARKLDVSIDWLTGYSDV